MPVLNRSDLTGTLLTMLTGAGVLVGDHHAPKEGGWEKGQANVGEYRAYSVLFSGPMNATQSGIRIACYDYQLTYSLRSYGISREQADDLSFQIASVFNQDPKFAVGSGYKSHLALISASSGANRIDSEDPKRWQVTDTLTVRCVPT